MDALSQSSPAAPASAPPRLEQFRRIVIKVGSSLLVDRAQGRVKREWLACLAQDISALHGGGADLLVVSSGSVALGRTVLGLPDGVLKLEDSQAAAAVGQDRGFVMDLRRLAAVPLTLTWFPRLNQPDRGIRGHMPNDQQRRYLQVVEGLLTRRSELVERLGPLWPGLSKR